MEMTQMRSEGSRVTLTHIRLLCCSGWREPAERIYIHILANLRVRKFLCSWIYCL